MTDEATTEVPQAQAEMPRYRSQAEVRALKLDAIYATHSGDLVLRPADKGYADIEVRPMDYLYHQLPGVNHEPGYLVTHADGLRTWSPTKAFEEHYTRIDRGEG